MSESKETTIVTQLAMLFMLCIQHVASTEVVRILDLNPSAWVSKIERERES